MQHMGAGGAGASRPFVLERLGATAASMATLGGCLAARRHDKQEDEAAAELGVSSASRLGALACIADRSALAQVRALGKRLTRVVRAAPLDEGEEAKRSQHLHGEW
jgi:hypothetical protein